MMSDWTEYSLADLGDVKTGKTPPGKVSDAYGGVVPFITPRDMDGRKWITSTERYLSENGLQPVKNSLVPVRSVAVSCIGSDMGKAAMVARPSVTNQQINTVIVDEERFNAEFVYYNLSVRQDELKSIASGSATPILNKGHFSNVKIRLPLKNVQDSIVEILRSIDDKIQLNRQTNQTLEQIAQAIFKSWFVDFEPVRAKIAAKQSGQDPELAAICAISGETEEQLNALGEEALQQLKATAALFPDALVESELGEVPEGWSMDNFSKLAKLVTTSVKPYDHPNKMWEHYSIPAFDINEHPSHELGSEIKSNKYRVDKYSVLCSKLNPHFPRTWWPEIADEDAAICSTEFMQFIPRNKSHRSFVLGIILSQPFQEGISKRVTGSTGSRQRAQPSQVANMDVLIPSVSLVERYSSYLECFSSMKAKRIKENVSLAKVRDTLLPKLLTGEIIIEDTNSTASATTIFKSVVDNLQG